ncbi:AI-2E family transporter [Ruegeria arenilitoris]|uniref:AI-2 transport protein TqsA n=1 Tax=Ruegeria arenilitoris TaxID=1173585 RepID=A0A238KXL2_9RHOB|nr:AI-2E family transporter [Ruegeria arenilitoris]SMX46952.1 AI-2 transport protein TqsA [Ruegeria arenilitoris]
MATQPKADNQRAGKLGLTFWYQLVVLLFLTIASLVLASSVLIPLSFAILLFVLLTATSDRIHRIVILGHSVPKWMAHLGALCLILFGLLIILSILSSQAGLVSEAFPKYEERLSGILAKLVALVGNENYAAAQKALSQINLSGFAGSIIGSAGAFLSAFFLVLLYVPFMLVERLPMQTKIDLAISDPTLASKVRNVLHSTSASIQRYVGIKTFVSALTGFGSFLVMWAVGLDFAETWAVLAFLLNFIPTVGSIIGVALPSLVALVQFEEFSPFLMVLLGCGAVQFSVGNILEPTLLGKSLNLSPLMVILALTFWTAIWGIPGALMSVPITVCIMIILTHIPATRPIAILMSGDGRVGPKG